MLPIVITPSAFCQEPYSPPQSNSEFFCFILHQNSFCRILYLLAYVTSLYVYFLHLNAKPFAGYQQSLSSGPTKFKHFSANASSSCYMQYRILLNFLFEIPTGSQTTPFEDSKVPNCLNLFHLIPGVLTHVLCHSVQLWAKNPIFLLLHF